MQRRVILLTAAAFTSAALAGCHGFATTPSVVALQQEDSAGGALRAKPNATIMVTIPTGHEARGLGGRVYRDWSGAAPITAFAANLSRRAKGCASAAGGRVCTVPVFIPRGGPYAIDLRTFADPPVRGSFGKAQPIGGGVVAARIAAGTKNVIALTTGNVLAGASIALAAKRSPALLSKSIAAVVTGYDADGNAILSSGFAGAKAHHAWIAVSVDEPARKALAFPARVNDPSGGAFNVSYSSGMASDRQMQDGFTATFATLASTENAKAAAARIAFEPPRFVERALSNPNAMPQRIVLGSDGALWFCEYSAAAVARMTTSLIVTNAYSGDAFSSPQTIALGPDGAIWVANWSGSGGITRISPSGMVTPYALAVNTYPAGISRGPNQTLWWGSVQNNYESSISPNGTLGPQHALPRSNSYPLFSTLGPDGNEYVVFNGLGQIAQFTPAGTIAHVYTEPGTNKLPQDIIAGTNNVLWFADTNQSAIYSMTTTGTFRRYAIAKTDAPSGPLAFGPDGKLWFASGNGVGRLDPKNGDAFVLATPTAGSGVDGIALANDAFFITEALAGKVARLQ